MKRSKLNKMSPAKVQAFIDQGKPIPASSFLVAKKLGNTFGKKKRGPRSRKTWDNEGNLHGSTLQALVYRDRQLEQMAGEITHLRAEIDYTLNAEGGLQVGTHRVDIEFFVPRKKLWQFYNVKHDHKGCIDALSSWKRRHFLKQYPTINGFPVRYDWYICFATSEGVVERVFRKESELLEALGQ